MNKKPKERRYCNYILVQGVFILLITLKGSLEMCPVFEKLATVPSGLAYVCYKAPKTWKREVSI